MTSTQAERITALEVKVEQLRVDVASIDGKLDELLALRNKGAGVFWLASCLFGTAIVGALNLITNWIRG